MVPPKSKSSFRRITVLLLVVKLFPHQVNDRMGGVLVEFHAVGAFQSGDVSGKLNGGKLHTQADAQKGYLVFPGIPNGLDLALKPR